VFFPFQHFGFVWSELYKRVSDLHSVEVESGRAFSNVIQNQQLRVDQSETVCSKSWGNLQLVATGQAVDFLFRFRLTIKRVSHN
jgi:hypothetical protein